MRKTLTVPQPEPLAVRGNGQRSAGRSASLGITFLLFLLSVCAPGMASAQGGPPLVTDDPDTPGNGHWETNIGWITTRTEGRLDQNLPDLDLNYGWGDHLQLKADVPFTFSQSSAGGSGADLGTAQLGVKWRFVDRDDAGVSVSTYPQYSSAWLSSSRRRGIAANGHEFFLPVEVSTEVGGFVIDGEVGRNFVAPGTDQWVLGGILAHECAEGIECMAELHERWGPGDRQTLFNAGVRWTLSKSLALLGAIGREVGTKSADQQQLLVYFGIQVLR